MKRRRKIPGVRARRAAAWLLAAAPLALLGGCTVGPDYHAMTPERALPKHFAPGASAGKEAPPGGAWWRPFGDPALDALISAALRNSPDLASAQANIRQARANVAQVASATGLQLDAQGRVGRDSLSRNSEGYANVPFLHPKYLFDDYRAGFDVSWEIDLFGHTARAVEAASAQTGVAEAQRSDVALRVAAETARNVLDYRYLRLRGANARQSVADNAELLRLVQLQRDAGLASDSDVEQAAVALHNAQAVVPPLQAAARASVAALVPLTALTQEQITARLGANDPQPGLPAAQSFAVSSTLLQRRPDVREAERALAAATAQVGVATADRFPRFTLVGNGGWDTIQAGSLWQQASQSWSVGPQLYLPLLNGGRVSAEIGAAEAGRDAALANYRKAVLAALADVETALLRCQGDDGRLVETSAALARQGRTVELVQLRLDAGESSRLELLGDRLTQRTLQEQQLSSRQSLSEDLVLLYKALGGGVAPTE